MTSTTNSIKTIGIVGLGLMGGSMAKAIKTRTGSAVYGYDRDGETMAQALASGAIDGPLEDYSRLDLLVVALFPQAAVAVVKEAACRMKAGSIICDICGVKDFLCQSCCNFCRERGVEFIGCHPMAGREKWGFGNSDPDLFVKASMILCPEGADPDKLELLQGFWLDNGFARCVVTTAANHDRMISYTSQLAHVLSNAYMKNPAALESKGYTGGSFQDLTRVAKLNPTMWTELFFCNRERLLRDCDTLIEELSRYRDALAEEDPRQMEELLQDGSDRKEQLLSIWEHQ